MTGSLNLDVPGSIAEFETLINKILPKKIFYKIILRGKALEFESYRKYDPSEDASFIDWKASSRSNQLLARRYIEEMDLKVMFIIDVGENMVSGSTEKLKCEYCVELISALAHVVMNTGDKIGILLYNDKVVRMMFPNSGKKYFDIIVNEISQAEHYGGGSDINIAIDSIMGKLIPTSSLVILVSDFIKINQGHKSKFRELSELYETIAIMVKDPLDKTLPDINKEIIIGDYNTGEKLVINPSVARAVYERNALEQIELVKRIFNETNIDFTEFTTSESFSYNLAGFLKRRAEHRRY